MTRNQKCELYVRKIAQRFVNNARSGKYSYITLADEYFEIIAYCREVYGICPNQYGNLYDRLPTALQDRICKVWEEATV